MEYLENHILGLKDNVPHFLKKKKIEDYSFQINLASKMSDIFVQENGMPQGTVLSPILFSNIIDTVTSHPHQVS